MDDGLRAGAEELWRLYVKISWPIVDLRRVGCGRDSMLLSSKVMSSNFVSSNVSLCVVFDPFDVFKLWKLVSAFE